MIQIYEDDTEMIVNHDPQPDHYGRREHHEHGYPFHWGMNYTIDYDNDTYLSDTSVIFMGLFCTCFMVKVLAICTDYYSRFRGRPVVQRGAQTRVSEQAARIVRQVKINSKTRVIAEEGLQGELLNECSICLEDFDVGQKISELPCCHLFHKGCVEQWMQNNHNCPLCRLSV